MPAYIVAHIDVTDPVAFETYRAQAPAVIAAHGGRYLVRGGAFEMLEGPAVPPRQVVLEFADMARLQAFYHSPEYQALAAIRHRAAHGSLLAMEGVALA